MSLSDLESEVQKLSPRELSAFTRWLDEFTATQWDKQIDFWFNRRLLAPLPGCGLFLLCTGGIAPLNRPAIRCHPSGMKGLFSNGNCVRKANSSEAVGFECSAPERSEAHNAGLPSPPRSTEARA
jgi:hypothetical protein